MMLDEVKATVEQLPENEKWTLLEWLGELVNDNWDRQMEADAAAGRLDWMKAEVDDAIRRGDIRPFPWQVPLSE